LRRSCTCLGSRACLVSSGEEVLPHRQNVFPLKMGVLYPLHSKGLCFCPNDLVKDAKWLYPRYFSFCVGKTSVYTLELNSQFSFVKE